jgi:hypothetical protein
VGVALELAPASVTVAPGAEVVVTVRVRNTGEVVDQVDLTVLGTTADWARAQPGRLNLLPGQQELVELTFAPPRSWTVPAGDHPYAVQAAAREDPDGSEIQEGRVTVEPFQELVAELVPRTSRAPRAGHHDVAVDNLGNHPVLVNLSANGAEDAVDFRWARGKVLAEPGTATLVHLRARPTTRFLRGADRSLPFEVVAAGEEGGFVTASGAVRQRAILAPSVVLLLLLVALLAVLWAAVIRPRLNRVDEAVARTAAVTEQALAPAQKQLNDSAQAQRASSVAAAAKAHGTGAADGGNGITPAAGSAPGTTTGPGGAAAAGNPAAPNPAVAAPLVTVSFRASVTIAKTGSPTQTQTRSLPVPVIPSGGLLRISGITFDTAGGDQGTLQIARGGTPLTVLLSLDLATLDNLSYQFDQPLEFTSTQPLVVTAICQACTPSVLFSGQGTLPAPAAAPSPAPAATPVRTPTPTPAPRPTAATATQPPAPKPGPIPPPTPKPTPAAAAGTAGGKPGASTPAAKAPTAAPPAKH